MTDRKIKANRIKPKPSMKNKPKISSQERDYLQWFAEQSHTCFICGTHYGIEGHHVKEHSTDRKDHTSLLPLCSRHHTGPDLSPHGTPKRFREAYPMEVQRRYAAEIYKSFLETL